MNANDRHVFELDFRLEGVVHRLHDPFNLPLARLLDVILNVLFLNHKNLAGITLILVLRLALDVYSPCLLASVPLV